MSIASFARDQWPEERFMGPSVTYPKGSLIFRQGDVVQALYLIVAGVTSLCALHNGRDVLTAVRGPRSLLGVTAAIRGGRHPATSVTMTPCDLRILSVDDFHNLRKGNLAVGEWLQLILAEEAAEQLRRAVLLTAGDCRSRLEQLFGDLFRVSAEMRSDRSVRLTLDVSVTQVADLVAASRERVCRVLSAMAGEAVLIRKQGWFVAPPGSPLIQGISRHGLAGEHSAMARPQ